MGSYLDKLLLGYRQVDSNGIPLRTRQILNFIGFTVVDNPSLGTTDVFGGSSGGSGGGGLLLVENAGTPMPLEPIINFVGCSVVDDPGGTRTTITPAPTPPLIVESNGGGITQRAALDLIGFGYVDDSIGNRMRFMSAAFLPAPVTITGTGSPTIGPLAFWQLMQPKVGGYTITVGAISPGLIYRLQTIPGGGTNFASDPAILSRGTNTFTIEDPQNRYAATANTANMQTDGVVYEWCLDQTNNVLRCMRQVQ